MTEMDTSAGCGQRPVCSSDLSSPRVTPCYPGANQVRTKAVTAPRMISKAAEAGTGSTPIPRPTEPGPVPKRS